MMLGRKISLDCARIMIGAFQMPEQRQLFIANLGSQHNFLMKMANGSVQRSVEKNLCSKCLTVRVGTRVRDGFLCEECIRVFMIRKQLWVYPAEFRFRVIVNEGLKRR